LPSAFGPWQRTQRSVGQIFAPSAGSPFAGAAVAVGGLAVGVAVGGCGLAVAVGGAGLGVAVGGAGLAVGLGGTVVAVGTAATAMGGSSVGAAVGAADVQPATANNKMIPKVNNPDFFMRNPHSHLFDHRATLEYTHFAPLVEMPAQRRKSSDSVYPFWVLMQQAITLFDASADPSAPAPIAASALPEQLYLPDAYRLPDGVARGPVMPALPAVVFIEVTNRCNLLCETCPRTYFNREPLRSLTYDEFVHIAAQFPAMRRCTLHGIGEPLLNRELPQMIAYLKGRGVETLFNSNGALLTPAWQEALARSGLDEFRCSIDGARPETYARIRRADVLHKVVAGLAGLVRTQISLDTKTPRISIWCVATRENLGELPDLMRLAARLGVPEVYLQRMTFFAGEPDQQYGMAREALAIFDSALAEQEAVIAECEQLSAELGVAFRASGGRDGRGSLAAQRSADAAPWRACLRPWTTAYITANGNCLPCCISPFTTSDYDSLILGNLFERPFADIWNEAHYRGFRTKLLTTHPHKACANCGVAWSL